MRFEPDSAFERENSALASDFADQALSAKFLI